MVFANVFQQLRGQCPLPVDIAVPDEGGNIGNLGLQAFVNFAFRHHLGEVGPPSVLQKLFLLGYRVPGSGVCGMSLTGTRKSGGLGVLGLESNPFLRHLHPGVFVFQDGEAGVNTSRLGIQAAVAG